MLTLRYSMGKLRFAYVIESTGENSCDWFEPLETCALRCLFNAEARRNGGAAERKRLSDGENNMRNEIKYFVGVDLG